MPDLFRPDAGVSVVAFVATVVLFTGALTGMWSRPRTTTNHRSRGTS